MNWQGAQFAARILSNCEKIGNYALDVVVITLNRATQNITANIIKGGEMKAIIAEMFFEVLFMLFAVACLCFLALEVTEIKSKVDAIHKAVAVEEAK